MIYSYDYRSIQKTATTAPRGAVELVRKAVEWKGGSRWLKGLIDDELSYAVEAVRTLEPAYFYSANFAERVLEAVNSLPPKDVDDVLTNIWSKISSEGNIDTDSSSTELRVRNKDWDLRFDVYGGQFNKWDPDDPDGSDNPGSWYEEAPPSVKHSDEISKLARFFGDTYPYVKEKWEDDPMFGDEYWNMTLQVSVKASIDPETLFKVAIGKTLNGLLKGIKFPTAEETYAQAEREHGDYWSFKRGDKLVVVGGPGARKIPVDTEIVITKGGDSQLEVNLEGRRVKVRLRASRKRDTYKMEVGTSKSTALLVQKVW